MLQGQAQGKAFPTGINAFALIYIKQANILQQLPRTFTNAAQYGLRLHGFIDDDRQIAADGRVSRKFPESGNGPLQNPIQSQLEQHYRSGEL